MSSATSCTPNISSSGRRRRRGVGYVAAVFSVVLTLAFIVTRAAWFVRLVVLAPAALSAVGFLQASRGTCIAHAATGKIEHEDFSTTKAPAEELATSRVVAAGIRRDALLVGLLAAALAAATSRIM